ncbi:MAG: regulatory iron-sulfur-containing complex subunit RicT [Bacteroidetes bacterium]|nr:regulatory iron-sulfur-containing complex subunit RicT [Bacteroidota bacterium]
MSGCNGCSTKSEGGLPTGCKNNGWCSSGGCKNILDIHDWLSNVYYLDGPVRHKILEVRFKGTRKEFYQNTANIHLEIGDAVVVESAMSGWDLGYVSMTGELVEMQMKKHNVRDTSTLKRIIRPATETDIAKYEEAKSLEQTTMMRSRERAVELGLVMKISDVEYQGDKTKATFYYTAEGRVDFRELIKIYSRDFKVKIEMKQVGLRQEAGRLGGIGSCGRELCCSTWLTDFQSVNTTAARYQNLFLNPLKLSGQCGRLKCCLNYELDNYVEAYAEFPDERTKLKTEKGTARIEKMDILKRMIWVRYEDIPDNKFYPIDLADFYEMLEMNKQGKAAGELEDFIAESEVHKEEFEFKDVVGEESLNRFDRKKTSKTRNKNKNKPQGARGNQGASNTAVAPNPNQNRPQQPRQEGGNQNRPAQPNPNRNQNPNQNRNANPNANKIPNQNRNKNSNPNPNQARPEIERKGPPKDNQE